MHWTFSFQWWSRSCCYIFQKLLWSSEFYFRKGIFEFITARKRSLRRLGFYKCLTVHGGGGWYPRMPCRWYPSMPCRSPGGVSRPTPRGRLRGLAGGGSPGPHLGGLQAHTRGSPGPHPGVYPSMHWGRPPTADDYWCGRYASYWNTFLFLGDIFIMEAVFFSRYHKL